MRKSLLGLLGAAFLAALPLGSALAQVSPNQVTETGTTPRSGVICQTAANPAVNTQNTLTFNVPAGVSLYLTKVRLDVVADGTGGTALSIGRFTTTNLNGIEWDTSFAGTASTATNAANESNPNGLVKSAVGPLNVTIVSPAAGTHNAYPMHACGFFAQ